MDYKQEIAGKLHQLLSAAPYEADIARDEIFALLEIPKDPSMGDHAFPCFRLAKALRQAPPKIAAELAPKVTEAFSGTGLFSGVEAAGPYLNFRVDKAGLAAWLVPAVLSGEFLDPRPRNGERVMIEYSQPNTHKAFHVGHTRNVALGDCMVRLCEWAGYDVVAANYIGDVGAHIAKCLWYYENHFDGEVPAENRGEFLGELYTNATELLDFTTLTEAPHPGVVTARVESVEKHPSRDGWTVVTVATGAGSEQVVCGGKGFAAGDVVAYATLGSRIGGREVQEIDKEGVTSRGMICSETEISLGESREKIFVFAEGTPVGVEIAEHLRVDGALPADRSVLEEMRERDEDVRAVLQRLESGEPEITKLWQETRQWSLDDFHAIYEWLDARFDHYFYESEVAEPGKKVVKEYLEKGVLVRSEGAVGIDLSEHKLAFFLLLKSDGTGLYSTKDLALAQLKFDEFQIDRSVYVVDVGQSLHFQQVFKTLELMGYERAKLCHHLAYGIVTLPEGKMSSRKGNVILFSQLKQGLVERIVTEFLEKYRGDWSDAEIDDAARWVAVGTIKYGMLKQDSNKNIIFDLEEWTDSKGNTGPYLMMAYARTRSILRKVDKPEAAPDWSLLTNEFEQEVLRRLDSFTSVVTNAAENYEPHLLCTFLYDLSKDFSRMYRECSVKHAETEPLKAARCALVEATGKVIGRGLELLGITPRERL